MAAVRAEAPEQRRVDRLVTVFDGSAPEDVSHARRLWSSVSLLPPLEARLVAADVRQRLPVSRPQRAAAAEPLRVPAARQQREERQRYAAMAEQRKEILFLLRRQRERRIQKELLSAPGTPRPHDNLSLVRRDEIKRNMVDGLPNL
uniref:Cilia- and flagella-associated protein HOATZ n=1 Tax=Scophthalmus maximus TaxID=52904 RepID=A0A8D3AU74_SCOMX